MVDYQHCYCGGSWKDDAALEPRIHPVPKTLEHSETPITVVVSVETPPTGNFFVVAVVPNPLPDCSQRYHHRRLEDHCCATTNALAHQWKRKSFVLRHTPPPLCVLAVAVTVRLPDEGAVSTVPTELRPPV